MKQLARSARRAGLAALAMLASAAPAVAQDYRARLPQDEVIYFALPDRFDNADPANDRAGLTGDRLVTGYDPTVKGFYHGGDQDAREEMFGSRVASYNGNRLLGTATTTVTPHLGRDNPLFRQIATLARVRRANPTLTRGRQVLRAREEAPGLLAISRFDPASGAEVLLAFNTSTAPLDRQAEVGAVNVRAHTLAGTGCASRPDAPGSLRVTLPPLGYAVCALDARP